MKRTCSSPRSVRQLNLPDQKRSTRSVLKPPTHLIEAFKSTLAEAASADLLIQVIDYLISYHEGNDGDDR
ncbi:hypothetical protein ACW180_06405 [Limosilactobacillus fermentum]